MPRAGLWLGSDAMLSGVLVIKHFWYISGILCDWCDSRKHNTKALHLCAGLFFFQRPVGHDVFIPKALWSPWLWGPGAGWLWPL